MWNKITDGIRNTLRAIVGMVGYTIVEEYELARKDAEITRLTIERNGMEANWLREKKKKLEKYLDDYSYAILVGKNDVTPTLWNEGRFEPRVRTITFLAVPGSVPELTIKK